MPQISSSSPVLDISGDPVIDWIARAYRRDTGALVGSSLTRSAGDANYSDVALLLDMDGINGVTTFVDKSSSPKTVTTVGDAQMSSAQRKFGSTSLLLDGTGDYLSMNSSALALSGTSHTVEAWVYITSLPSTTYGVFFNGVLGSNNSRIQLEINSSGQIYVFITNSGGAATSVVSSINMTLDAWVHMAYCNSAGAISLFVDGALGATGTFPASVTASNEFYVGVSRGGGTTRPLAGYIDDFRVTAGVARYSSNFTPPAFSNPYYSNSVDQTGQYVIDTGGYSGECNVVCLDGGSTYNDLILRTTPV